MANSKDNLRAYGKSFIGFDEPSGNVIDTLGGWTGTLYNSPIRVTGWNGKGYAMSFNGTNQYIHFNNPVISQGAKTVRVKFKPTAMATSTQIILSTIDNSTTTSGYRLVWHSSGLVYQVYKGSSSNIPVNLTVPPSDIKINSWNDIIITDDGLASSNSIKIYIDGVLKNSATGISEIGMQSSSNLSMGANSSNALFLNGQLDSIEIYDRVISFIPDKYLVQHNSQYKYHNGTSWQTTMATETNFKQYGMSQLSQITEAQWEELTGDIGISMWSDFQPKEFLEVNIEVEPFSVYDYIGETPSVIAYTESTEDIIVSTTTEPFDIYDEFGDSVEVLYYTDDETVTNADLILEANWSPIDELEGDFEVVTWTDEEEETAKRKLEMNTLPVPQFVYPITLKSIKNGLQALFAKDLSSDTRARFLLTPNNTTWYTWKQDNFVPITLTNENIMNEGLTAEQLSTFSPTQLEAWTQTSINIGVFLADDVRGDNVSQVSEIGYSTELYSDTPKVEDIDFYILNTTATINVELNGLTLTGQVDDADMTRVQYRVILNDAPYYPDNGAFTPLSAPPLNIDIAFRSDEIKIGDWNTVRVEFQDSFGTMDYWEAKFVGQYAGLMFQDESGNYYSSDIGEVLQYLDFGQILTGQVSIVHEVKVENTYGFDLTDVKIAVNTNQFAQGLSVQLGLDPENMQSVKTLSLGDLVDTASTSFFIRLASSIDAIPNDSKTFNIVATANRKLARN